MGKRWDKAVPSVEIWRESLRVLKSGAFAFIMCIPRQDCLARMICNLSDAGFNTNFTSIYWTYAEGFPKAMNVSLAVDRRACLKELTAKLGRKPSKDEFQEAWKNFREVVGEREDFVRRRNKTSKKFSDSPYMFTDEDIKPEKSGQITTPVTPEAKVLDGSFAGLQPKPALEIILVAMRPLSEKSYVDQALKNRHGISWLDSCRIPFQNEDTPNEVTNTIPQTIYGGGKGFPRGTYRAVEKGRFPANLLCSDDALNDGKTTKSPSTYERHADGFSKGIYRKGIGESEGKTSLNYGDEGSFSRFFSLDAWFEAQFLIVPKASKSERNRGVEDLYTLKDDVPEEIRKEIEECINTC